MGLSFEAPVLLVGPDFGVVEARQSVEELLDHSGGDGAVGVPIIKSQTLQDRTARHQALLQIGEPLQAASHGQGLEAVLKTAAALEREPVQIGLGVRAAENDQLLAGDVQIEDESLWNLNFLTRKEAVG